MGTIAVWTWRFFGLFGLLGAVVSISFTVEPEVKKCIREEVHKDVLVVGNYELAEVAGQVTDLTVSFFG